VKAALPAEPEPVAMASEAPPPPPPIAAPTSAASATLENGVYSLPKGGVDLEKLEREYVLQAIAEAKGNKSKAGRLLGLNRDQVRYRLEKWGMTEHAEKD
jgi:DNA-binding NtrC family response regulator